MADNYTDMDKHQDTKLLHGMGYAQELSRSMSKFSNFAISFSIICILSGAINSFSQATGSIGGAAAGIAWIVGCIVSGFFALSMAQIASAFPTAGGLYHWGAILGNRAVGWFTAWLNLLGLITVLGAINIGTAFYFQLTFGSLIGMTTDPAWIVGFVVVITVVQAIFNHVGIKVTTMLTDISGYIIFATTAVLVLACLFLAPHLDFARLWTFKNYSGPAGGGIFPQSTSMSYLFLLCLLWPIYTITGYDASAHTSEETERAAYSVPSGIVNAVIWSSLIGWIMVCAIMLAIPDLDAGAASGGNVFVGMMDAIMPSGGLAALKVLIYIGILVAQLLCGLATVTSASRMLFAFSRDGGMPMGSKALASVSPTYRTPVTAIWTATVISLLYVILVSFIPVSGGSAFSLYFIVVNSTLVFLFLSFTVPLIAGAMAFGGPKWPTPGPWSMGAGLYKLVTALAVIGMVIIFYIAIQPPSGVVLYIVIGFLILAAVLWFTVENRRFQGPPIGDEVNTRAAAIAAAERAVGEKG